MLPARRLPVRHALARSRRIPAGVQHVHALILASFIFLALAFVALLGVAPSALRAQDEPERTPCELVPGKWAAPGQILLGEQVTVTLTSSTDCPEARVPLRVVLAIDSSNSMMRNNKLRDAQQAARDFVQRMDFAYSKVGVVAFSDRGYVMQEITDNRARIIGAINDLRFVFGTDIEGGLAESLKLLLKERRDDPPEEGEPTPIEVVIMLSDGKPFPRDRHGRSEANQLKGEGVHVFTICVGTDCDPALMRSLASEREYYFSVRNSGRLSATFQDIADRLLAVTLVALQIDDTLPDNMVYVDDSADPPTTEIDDSGALRVLRWRWEGDEVPTESVTLTYRVEPQEPGLWPTNVEAVATYLDDADRVGSAPFPVPEVLVLVPRVIPTATPTPDIPPTATPTNTPPPTPTPTATPTPGPVYLPIALREQCDPKRRSADVVLVLDVSSSMDVPTRPGGKTKHRAAREAARAFLDGMRGPRDQVAIVVFDAGARVLRPLGDDRAAARRAVDALPHGEGTDIAAGLRAGLAEIRSARRRPDNSASLILLTDGRPTRGLESDVTRAASRVHEAGINVFAVGLGEDVNPVLLRRVAGEAARYFGAPRAEDLAGIYRRIATLVPCPTGRHDWAVRWP